MRRFTTFLGTLSLAAWVGANAVGCNDASVKTQELKPPPISGGTLHVTKGGLAIASDPDRDVVWIVKPNAHVVAQIALEPGDEPGRIAESADGRVHVALRGGGAVASFHPDAPDAVSRRAVCGGPRGIAFDAANDAIHVACVRGELVSYGLGDASERRLQLDEDLRDVVVEGDVLYVSRFRAAEILVVDADGAIVDRRTPLASTGTPSVAWRMIAAPQGGVLVSHQEANLPESELAGQGTNKYYGPQLLASTVSHLRYDAALGVLGEDPESYKGGGDLVLPVDLAVTAEGAFALAGVGQSRLDRGTWSYGFFPDQQIMLPARPVAVAFDAAGELLYQTREPATVAGVPLPVASRYDEGHETFHASPFGLACASCHPEGRDDGLTWRFNLKPRRTLALTGDVTKATPFHWDGDLTDMGAFMGEVFVRRMGGSPPNDAQVDAMTGYLASIPRLPARTDLDPEAVERGRGVFFDEQVGCGGCHAGEQLTNRSMTDVGTGALFKVPRLVDLDAHAPFMHDGCAARLEERFDDVACGGAEHGDLSGLSQAERADLLQYLRSL